MMDVYFEPGGDPLSLDEIFAGDMMRANFEFCLSNPLDGSDENTSGEDKWDSSVEWSSASLHSGLSLDLCGDPAAGVMVNPNSVMPRIKRERETEKVISLPQRVIKEEVEANSSESEHGSEEEEEEEEEDEDGGQENPIRIKVEPSHEEEEEHIVIVPDRIRPNNLWNTLVTRPIKAQNPTLKPRVIIKTEPNSTSITPASSLPTVIQAQPKEIHAQVIHQLQGSKQKKEVVKIGFNPAVAEEYPKPAYSYSCLIAMALKNSATGSLPVSEIYNFMCEHFPYFKSAPSGWKNSVRHNLSLNKCFEKIEKVSPTSGGSQRKGCLWAMNPSKITKMDDEVAKWSRKDPQAIRRAMRFPETLEKLERGDMKIGGEVAEVKSECESEESENESNPSSQMSEEEEEEEEDEDPGTEDEGEVPPSLKPFDSRLNSRNNTTAESNLAQDLGVEFSNDMYEELGLLQQVFSSSTDDDFDLYSLGTPSKKPKLISAPTASPTLQVIQRHAISSRQ